jgi:hypothetical protein
VLLANGDDVGVTTVWQYPETFTAAPSEVVEHVLAEIDRGMPGGQRYSNDNAATTRAAWPLVQKYCPDKTRNQCRQIISKWIKQGLLYTDRYIDPRDRKRRTGLFVRKPTAQN